MKLGEVRTDDPVPHPIHPIVLARRREGMSLRELGERTELSYVGISHLENFRTKRPSRRTKRLIERELGPIKWPEPDSNGHRPKKGKK